MPVVKPGQSAPLLRTAVVLDMGDVEAHAQRVLTEAHDRAAAAVDEAEHRAAHMIANADQKGHGQGFERGHSEGREQGTREGREQALRETRVEALELVRRWTAALEDWEARRDQLFDEAREDVLRFAFALAERVVHRLVRIDPAVVRDQVHDAFKHLGRPSSLQVSVHPQDRALVEQVLPEIVGGLGAAVHAQLHDDPTIDRGGCVIATAGGYVDASLATQLDRLAEALLRDGRLIERPPLQAIHLAGSPASTPFKGAATPRDEGAESS